MPHDALEQNGAIISNKGSAMVGRKAMRIKAKKGRYILVKCETNM